MHVNCIEIKMYNTFVWIAISWNWLCVFFFTFLLSRDYIYSISITIRAYLCMKMLEYSGGGK